VHVVFVVVSGSEEDVGVVVGDIKQFPFQVCPETVVDDLATIFGRDNEVIFAVIDAVARPPIPHAPDGITDVRMKGAPSIPRAYARGSKGAVLEEADRDLTEPHKNGYIGNFLRLKEKYA
jgi:hypothetical protein